ncbi:MAG: hypothetical protein UX34_C0028G0006 [Candidatus Woesebacteria bacterium GW2011_GWF1_46_13]|uniref:Glycosyltransferase RgtA/B/C/D-like domain-containing protein n=1 Tax=Candidatus Woesebacteria bacterium GW2011_GWF1_46_13 TaxID=1618602 RepID=A0A0G1NPY0_9BACT|nr:MAG: hypothetical protein UX34_C0028G0006 [Candidatus Woesebacteria bacterium GW2011_GWF1_46_13]
MEKIALRIKNWIRQNPKEAIILGVILLVATFLRLYRISEYMTFLGDEGRDVIIVRRLLVDFDPILIGPGTSIGNMYLGPLYYYLMAPALALAGLSPVGPAVQIALLGVATVFFVWYLARCPSFHLGNLEVLAGRQMEVVSGCRRGPRLHPSIPLFGAFTFSGDRVFLASNLFKSEENG